MTIIVRGDKYVARSTHNNHANGVTPRDDIRVGYIDDDSVSIWVISPGGRTRKLAVPKHVFGLNFEPDKSHTVMPNAGYFMSGKAAEAYVISPPAGTLSGAGGAT